MAKLQRTPELDHDDPGHDPLMAADATACHRAEMLELVEQSLERTLPVAERLHLISMMNYWQRALDRRLHQLAAGTKPSRDLLPDPIDNPALLAGIAAAARHWSPDYAVNPGHAIYSHSPTRTKATQGP